jgi:quercetin dioxygenase-like cupin family protein
VELTVGQQTQVLSVGDSAQFAGDVAHGYANCRRRPAARFCVTVFEAHVTGRPRR